MSGRREKKDEGNQMKNVEIREGRKRKRPNTSLGRGSNQAGVCGCTRRFGLSIPIFPASVFTHVE